MFQKYALSSKKLYEILQKKNVSNLHHANTVATSLTFIQQGALLSRAYVEKNGLIQTVQKTDSLDKYHEIFDSAFLDGTDHHTNWGRNIYGPILFKIKLDLLLDDNFKNVYITRSNPYHWDNSIALNKKFYNNLTEFNEDYTPKEIDPSGIMFTVRSPGKKIAIKKYVESIIVDDPKLRTTVVNEEIEILDHVVSLLQHAIAKSDYKDCPLLLRNHEFAGHETCNCYYQYKHLHDYAYKNFNEMFTRLGH